MGKKSRQTKPAKPSAPPPTVAPVQPWPRCGAVVLGVAVFVIYYAMPYWQIGQQSPLGKAFPWLLLAVLGGWIAAAWPVGPLPRWRRPGWANGRDLGIMAGLFAGLVLLHWRYLRMPFCWRGDEEFHIRRYIDVILEHHAGFGQYRWVLGLGLLLAVAIGLWSWLSSRRNVIGLAVLAVVGLYGFLALRVAPDPLTSQVGDTYWLLRYPPMIVPVQVLFANPFLGTTYHEAAHRLAALVPMALALLWVYAWLRRERLARPLAAGAVVVLAFMPMIHYQSSLLYIEPLMLLWMTLIAWLCWYWEPDESGLPGLYLIAAAAAFGGVVKETSLPYLVAVWLVLLAMLCFRLKLGWWRKPVHALRLGVVIALPALPYMYLRAASGLRGWQGKLEHLREPLLYANYWHSIWHYMTLSLVVAALAGLVWLAWRRRHLAAVLLAVLTAGGYGLFFAMDDLEYVGLVRFMVHFWPCFAVGLIGLLVQLKATLPARRLMPAVATLLVVLLAVNLALRPPSPAERGTWGIISHPMERHFPIDQALAVMQREFAPGTALYWYNLQYAYNHFTFYLFKYRVTKFKEFMPLKNRDLTVLGTAEDPRIAPLLALEANKSFTVEQVAAAVYKEPICIFYQREDGQPYPEDDVPGLEKIVDLVMCPRSIIVYRYQWPAAAPGEKP